MSNKYQTPQQLREALQELKKQFPRLYPRDLAAKLGSTEAQLTALGAGETTFKLTVPDVVPLLNGLGKLGKPLFIVRNDDAVLEREATLHFEDKGHYTDASDASGEVRLAMAKTAIASAFAVRAEKFVKRGLQFFDAAGTAVLKAYLRDETKIEAFDAWVQPWLSADQSDALEVMPGTVGKNPHTHDHANCHCAHGVEKPQAIEAPSESFKLLLNAAAKSGEPVALSLSNDTVFFRVGVPSIKKLAPMAPWFNILDDALHSHLREEAVTQAKFYTNKEKNKLKLASLSQEGKTLFILSVNLDGAAARELLPTGGAQ
ncbi:MAG: hypothetical protein LBD01_06270 [Puniceicoccales bacterium]|nr:hypothetical protein [Puniceicoccales bacterium]